MRAIVFSNGLHFRTDYPVPEAGDDEALIRVTQAGICNTDLEITKGYMGFEGIPGHEFVGKIEKCRDRHLVGKRVTGEINISCGKCSFCNDGMFSHCPNRSVLGILKKDGAFAEYITLPIKNIHVIPGPISNEEAVFTEPLAAAYEILHQVHVTPSHRVCVLGDGKLGLLVGMVLNTTGCKLLVLGRHKEKLAVLGHIGITTALVSDESALQKDFDIVVDCTGSASGTKSALELVKPRGTIVLKTTVAGNVPFDMNQIVIREITLIGSRCGPFMHALRALEDKTFDLRPMVSRTFGLEEGIVAFDYAARRGVLKVILNIG